MSRRPGHLMPDYETARREFRLEVPDSYNWTEAVLDRLALDPRRRAMLWVDSAGAERTVTFAEFAAASRRFANVLHGLGVKRVESLFVMLPRVVEWWEVVLGSLRAGVIWLPGTTLLTAKDLEYRLNACHAVVAVTDEEDAPKFEEVRASCPELRHLIVVGRDYGRMKDSASEDFTPVATRSGEPAMAFFTSGTTGHPKMVLHTHASYPIAHEITGRFYLDNDAEDLHWTVSDTGWAQAAWTNLFAPWNRGAAVFIQDARGRFDAKATLGALERYPITTFFAPPTAYRMLVQEDLAAVQPKALRHTLGAGEPLNPEVIATWRDGMGLTIYDGYGQTETVLVTAMFPCLELRPGSMGKAAPGYDVAVVDPQGAEVATGEEGVLGIRVRPRRPVGLFTGYWHNAEASAGCLVGDFYLTGDRVRMDEDGYLWFVGRDDDVIISAGYRIGPFEVESALVEHPAVVEAAAIGVADPVRGQVVKA
ncbi:MAG TPA: AMP-binding protein, partial [Candidatus Dormibacteraeota bacterium]|nr:AMP-binding protein [Candidatus Dormibacteraeota bacterium]